MWARQEAIGDTLGLQVWAWQTLIKRRTLEWLQQGQGGQRGIMVGG